MANNQAAKADSDARFVRRIARFLDDAEGSLAPPDCSFTPFSSLHSSTETGKCVNCGERRVNHLLRTAYELLNEIGTR